MKLNKTRLALKILRMVKNLNSEDWCRVKASVDGMYFALRFLKSEKNSVKDDIDEIEQVIDSMEGKK